MLICWMVGVFLRNENNRGWLCEIFANEKIEISVSFVNFEKACKILNYKNLLDLWRLWKCKTLPNEFKSGKMKCFSSMEKDNQIKLKISVWELEKDPRWSPMVLGDFVFVKEGRGTVECEPQYWTGGCSWQLSQFTMSFHGWYVYVESCVCALTTPIWCLNIFWKYQLTLLNIEMVDFAIEFRLNNASRLHCFPSRCGGKQGKMEWETDFLTFEKLIFHKKWVLLLRASSRTSKNSDGMRKMWL